ncbi:MAG: hypothetical protein WCC57_19860 [Paracoccaceae bacterium]
MPNAAEFSDKMAELQKMRVALVILISQETSKLLSRRQRVAGKEIEVMCAERDLEEGGDFDRHQQELEELYQQDRVVRLALAETEQDIAKMEQLMAKVDADIASLCQS